MNDTARAVENALAAGLVVPAFNIPYLPMTEPVVRAAVDTDSFALVQVARLEWRKFEAQSLEAVAEAYNACQNPAHVRLHLDHVPVIDEDDAEVDFLAVLERALACGYHSVMVDGSRLPLEDNIRVTRQAAALAHTQGVPCEAELGAVFGHEDGPPPPYDELFASGRGFTDVEEARRFVNETRCDWLSVAVGSVHGAVSEAYRDQKKPDARVDLEHLAKLRAAAGIPLVLHGGSGIQRDYVLEAVKRGIAKINVGTEIRQAYEQALRAGNDVAQAQQACYERTCWILRDYYNLAGTRSQVLP